MKRLSPSSRGRGLKSEGSPLELLKVTVALFTRAWIEIAIDGIMQMTIRVALFTRAWIEIQRHIII